MSSVDVEPPASNSPARCPLCGQNNHCGNLNDSTEPCWCADASVSFSDSLLRQVPEAERNKACICKACAAQSPRD
ncbi:cysteine-rich CWC family protein [Atopomonas sediminilitoris]|uniref:cysteine-rich CWC family protein n=1 Tax=Atopomonas sediminilitoris TaxID=2919919 RepID=UPI001F4E34BC|nr:cysteine-rich CWC family protein [Atopomonas sediminilitoris]MCJ8169670.1 cysteine-rich CWC family protein [Atopomonas sediminilitoris]